MTFASHIFRQSKQLRNATGLLRQDHASMVRWFTHSSRSMISKVDDTFKHRQINNVFSDNINICGCKACSGSVSSTPLFTRSYRAVNFTKVQNGHAARSEGTTGSGMVFSRGISCSDVQLRRSFATNSGLPPHQELGMPSLSPTMTEGNIARWLKKEGDQVVPGEVLCEVETDKATVEMECMEEGYLAKIIHGDGAKEIKVGEVIAITVEDKDDIEKFKDYKPQTSDGGAPQAPPASTPAKEEVVEKSPSPSEPKVVKPPSTAPETDRVFASPLARKLAEDNNVSLSSIKGTGPDGSIVKADIEEYLASGKKDLPAAPSKTDAKATVSAINYTDIPNSQIRKVTASRLLLSKQTIPHYYLTVDTCVDKLTKLHAELNALQEASGGKKISINDLVIKAAALALRKVPQCNSSWTNDYIRQFHEVHINVAVQTDNGLFVPVVRDADKKGLSPLSSLHSHIIPSSTVFQLNILQNLPTILPTISSKLKKPHYQNLIFCSTNQQDQAPWSFESSQVVKDQSMKVQRRDLLLHTVFASFSVPAMVPFALAEEVVPEGFRIYVDDVNKFNIMIPQDWLIGGGEGNGFKSVTAFYPSEASNSNVSLVITGLGADFTKLESFGKVDAFAENLVSGLDRSWQRPPGVSAKLIDSKATKGMYYIEYTLKNPGESERHLFSVLGIANNGWYNRLYTLTGQYIDEESEKYRSKVEKAVASFKLV